MRVLYLNHTAQVSGAERSLLDLLGGLPASVSATVACPTGPLAREVRLLGLPVVSMPAQAASLRLHPLHTPLGLAAILRTALRVRAHTRRCHIDLVHANSVRAGLAAVLAARLGGPPAIVHVRDILPHTRSADLVRRTITGSAQLVVANSRFTARAFASDLSGADVHVVYNPVDLARFDPDTITREDARARLGLPAPAPVLGLVAQITPWKGQDTAIRALASVRRRWPEALLLIVGEAKFAAAATRYSNEAYLRSLRQLVHTLNLDSAVRFLGERADVPVILRALDLLLVPSWEEPFGRTVIEAMAMATAVIATDQGGPAEIIDQGIDGLLVPPRDPAGWSGAITALLADPASCAAFGRRGRATVQSRFSRETHVAAVVALYRSLL